MNVKLKKISEKNGVVKVLVSGVDATFMNSIRRTVMRDVPTLAVEEVYVYDNSSALFDEFLAHRLAMVPITTDAKSYKEGESVKMVLEKEGPGMVYSKDIKSTDPKTEVADKKIPLVQLVEKQHVKMEMDAVMGKGSEHTKWQPAVISYSQEKQDQFTLNIESHGSYSAEGVLLKAAEELELKVEAFRKEMKKL